MKNMKKILSTLGIALLAIVISPFALIAGTLIGLLACFFYMISVPVAALESVVGAFKKND